MASLLHMTLLSLMLLSASTLATPAPLASTEPAASVDAEPDTLLYSDDGAATPSSDSEATKPTAAATNVQSESQGGTESDEPVTTTERLSTSVQLVATTSEQSNPGEIRECSGALTRWSPWTEKAENIKDNRCGYRRRTRKIRNAALALTCYGEDVELTEYVESCTQLSKEEAVRSFQYYVIDRLFGWSNLAPVTRRRRRRSFWLQVPPRVDAFNPLFPACSPNQDQRPVDFLIMLDKSGSMTKASYRQLRNSMANLISRGIPNVAEHSTRVALLSFASTAHLEMNFRTCVTKRCYRRRFRDETNLTTGGMTRIAHALQEASAAFTREKGSRECSRKVILLVTDGTSDNEPTPARIPATALKRSKNVEIFVVGVSQLINEDQLQEIASKPLMTHLYYMPTMRMVKKICKKLKTATVPEEFLVEAESRPRLSLF